MVFGRTACLCLIGMYFLLRQTKFYRATPSGVVMVHEDSTRVTAHFSVVLVDFLVLATSLGNHCHVYIRIDRFKNHECVY